MLFPVSGVEINPIIPFLIAMTVSFFTAMGGVSGAFILLPFQVSILNYTAPSVSATNHVFNIVAIPSGVYRYFREGRLIWPLTTAIVIGTLPGVFIGAWVRITYLPDPRAFKLFISVVLAYIGFKLFNEIVRKKKTKLLTQSGKKQPGFQYEILPQSNWRRVHFRFSDQNYSFSSLQILLLCFVVGIIGGVYGIGGGSIISPFLVTVIGLPVHAIAGAALTGTFVTSIAGVIFYHILATYYPTMSVSPDWLLGALLGAGGLVGMYMGARVQRYVPSYLIKSILCFCTLFVAVKYVWEFF